MALIIKIYGDTENYNTDILSHYLAKAFIQCVGSELCARKIVQMYEIACRKCEENADIRVYKQLMSRALEIAGKRYFKNFLTKEIIIKKGASAFVLNEKKYLRSFLDQVSLSLYPEAELA